MDIGAIRAGIKDLLEPVDNIRVYGYVPDAPNVPCLIVYPERIPYGSTYDGKNDPTCIIWCLAGTVSMKGAQERIDAWLNDTGSSSILAAIDSDPTLGGAVDSAQVEEVRNYGVLQLRETEGAPRYLSAEIVVSVLA